jgi:hypothetical protein
MDLLAPLYPERHRARLREKHAIESSLRRGSHWPFDNVHTSRRVTFYGAGGCHESCVEFGRAFGVPFLWLKRPQPILLLRCGKHFRSQVGILIFLLALYESDGNIEGCLRNFRDAISASVPNCCGPLGCYFIRGDMALSGETSRKEQGSP